MAELAPGDLAIIIQSMMGANVGKIVQCRHLDMPGHSVYGNIWMCSCKEPMMDEWGNMKSNIQIPAIWLKKIEPPPLNDKANEKVLIKKILERAEKLNW
jgi:hypothetical protein